MKKVVVTYTTGGGGTDPVQLSAPANLAASNETTSSIDLSWDAVSNASSYTVSYTPSGGSEQTKTNISGTSTTLSGLTAGTTYSIKIMAVGDGTNYSNSAYSSAISASTTGGGGGGGTYFDGTNSTDFILVNDASLLQAGDEVIVVNKAGTYAMQLKTTANQVDVAASVSNNIATSATATVLTLGGSSSGWSLSGDISGTTYYLYTTSDAAGGLSTKNAADTGWSISISSDGSDSDYAAITYSTNTRSIGYNSSAQSARFRLYSAGTSQYRVKLYARRPVSKTPLGTPSLTATTVGTTTATVTIADPSDSNVDANGYTVTVSPSGATYTTPSGRTIEITGLSQGTQYTVTAVANPTSAASASYEASAAGSVQFTTLTQLAAPTGLTAGATTSSSIALTWTGVANNNGYTISYTPAGGSEQTVDVAADATSHTLTSLTANTQYTIKILTKGTGSYVNSDYSAAITASTTPEVINMYMLGQYDGNSDFVPNRSKQLQYNSTTGLYSTTVYFNDVEDGYAFFSFATNTTDDPDGWAALNRVGANSADYNTVYTNGTNDHGDFIWLAGNSSNSFKIGTGLYLIETGSPSGDGGTSPWTGNNNWKMFIHALTLAAPTNVVASDTTTTSFKVTWDAVPNAVGYRVYVDGVEKNDVQGATTATVSNGISAANTYSVTVVAYASTTTSSASTAISVSTKPGNGHLAADGTTVTNDTSADPYAATTTTSFTFSGKSANATQYYSIDGGAVTEYTAAFTIGTVGAHSITFYSYYNGKVSATATRYVTITASQVPQGTTTVTTASVKHNSMTVNWTAVGDATGYKLTLSPAPEGGNPGDVGNVLTYAVTGLDAETTYTITVTPYNGVGDGTPTQITETTPAQPNNVFEKATTIAAGDEVIFVYENTQNLTASKALGKQNNNNRAAVDVTVADNKVEADEATAADDEKVFVFDVETDGTNFAFKSQVSGQYLYAANSSSGSNNYLRQKNDAVYWEVDLTTPELHDVTSSANNRTYMRYNTGSTLFSCYASTNTGPHPVIYKRSTSTLQPQDAPTGVTASNVTWNGATISWTAVSTATNGYTVTYTPDGGEAQTVTTEASSSATTVTLTNLLENTDYSVTVRANATGTHKASDPSDEEEFTTGTLARTTYEKVTAAMLAASDADAYEYIFVAPGDAAVMAAANAAATARTSVTEGVLIDDVNDEAKVPTSATISKFTISKSSGNYDFFDGTGYLSYTSGNNLLTVTEKPATAMWTIDTTNEAVKLASDDTRSIRYNKASNEQIFRVYAGTQDPVWLYRSTTKIALTAPAITGVEDGGEYRFANITIGVPTSATSVTYTLTPATGTPTSGTITADTQLPALVAGETDMDYTLVATAYRGEESESVTIEFTMTTSGESMATIDIPLNATTNEWRNDHKYTEAVSYLEEAADDDVKATVVTINGDAQSGRYFSSDQTWRIYKKGGSMTVSVKEGLQITGVEFVYGSSSVSTIEVSGGSYNASTAKWTYDPEEPAMRSVTFAPASDDTNGRTDYKYINVYYKENAATKAIETPAANWADDHTALSTAAANTVNVTPRGIEFVPADALDKIVYTTDKSDPRTSATAIEAAAGATVTLTPTQSTYYRVAATTDGYNFSEAISAQVNVIPNNVTFTPNGYKGVVTPQSVTIAVENNSSPALTNVKIYYTTDGTSPKTSETKQLYTGAISVSTTTTIKAFATTDDGETGSTVVSREFEIVDASAFNEFAAENVGRTRALASWVPYTGSGTVSSYKVYVYTEKPVAGNNYILKETFKVGPNSTAIGGRDGVFSGQAGNDSSQHPADNSGWSSSGSLFGAKDCWKLGSSSNGCTITTPEMTFSGTVNLEFQVAGWASGTLKPLTVSGTTNVLFYDVAWTEPDYTPRYEEHEGGVTSFTLTSSDLYNATEGAETADAQFIQYETTIQNTTNDPVRLTFTVDGSNKPLFIDEIYVYDQVSQEEETEGTEITGSPFSVAKGSTVPEIYTYQMTGLTPDTQYWYKVVAVLTNDEEIPANYSGENYVPFKTLAEMTLGEEVENGYIDRQVHIAKVYGGVAYGCSVSEEDNGGDEYVCTNPTTYSATSDYYSDKLSDFDQRDWIALYGVSGISEGDILTNLEGSQNTDAPGYAFTVTNTPTKVSGATLSVPTNTYEVHNLLVEEQFHYVRPQIYEYTTKFNAGLRKDGSTYVFFGNTETGTATVAVADGSVALTDGDLTADGEYREFSGIFTAVDGASKSRLRSGQPDLNSQSYQFITTESKGVVTGVQTLRTDGVEYRLRGIYNLQGQRVRETIPGQFYIINGKKTLVNSVIRDTEF